MNTKQRIDFSSWIVFYVLLLSNFIWYENALCLEMQISHLKNTYFLGQRKSTLYSFLSLVAAIKGNCVLSVCAIQGTVLHKCNGRTTSKVQRTLSVQPCCSTIFSQIYYQNASKLPCLHCMCLILCSAVNSEGCNFNPTLENIPQFSSFHWPSDLMDRIHGHRATKSFTILASML